MLFRCCFYWEIDAEFDDAMMGLKEVRSKRLTCAVEFDADVSSFETAIVFKTVKIKVQQEGKNAFYLAFFRC